MVLAGRRRTIAFFIALGAGVILFFLGVLLAQHAFWVREIRRNEQHDAFINAGTHELKTPVPSIRLYLETLQTNALDDAERREFYRTMLADSDRLLAPIEQILRTGP